MPRGNIHSRLEGLEARIPKPDPRTTIRPEVKEFLDGYAHRKVTGTLTPEDEEFAARFKAEVKRRRDAGLIGGGA